jgi:hypothetical protein
MTTKVSIALATLNGESYLQEQLDSYLAQDRLPDELVVSDDGSTDATAQILREFAINAPFEVRLHQNSERLGTARNFTEALLRCTGDLVLLSDQDDVWFRHKVSTLVQLHLEDPHLLYVNDMRAFEPDGRWHDRSFLESASTRGYGRMSLIKGCATALAQTFLTFGLPIYGDRAHDAWLHDLARRLGSRRVVPHVLQGYRLHPGQASGRYPEPREAVRRLLRGEVERSSLTLALRVERLRDLEAKLAAATPSDVAALKAFGCDIAAARDNVAAELSTVVARLAVVDPSGLASRARVLRGEWPAYRRGEPNGIREAIRDLLLP